MTHFLSHGTECGCQAVLDAASSMENHIILAQNMCGVEHVHECQSVNHTLTLGVLFLQLLHWRTVAQCSSTLLLVSKG